VDHGLEEKLLRAQTALRKFFLQPDEADPWQWRLGDKLFERDMKFTLW
jgi:hypothetical protein